MSTVSVSNIVTANGTEDLTITTGNTTGSKIVVLAGNGIGFYANSSTNAAFIDPAALSFNVVNKLEVGTHSGLTYDFGNAAAIEIDGNSNGYLQSVIQNGNTGNAASSDLVVTADNGNDSVNFVDLGINGSGYNQAAFNIGGAGDGYLYASNGNLIIGTASAKSLIFHTSGTTAAAEDMRIDAGGNVGIGNTAPNAKLQVTGTANISGNVAIAGTSHTLAGNVNIDAGTLFVDGVNNRVGVGNTAPAVALQVSGTANVGTNTLNLGTSTLAGNGYCYLPNGIKMNWGVIAANNSTGGNATFSSAFTTVYNVLTSGANSLGNSCWCAAVNTTVAQIRSTNAAAGGGLVYWTAIGV